MKTSSSTARKLDRLVRMLLRLDTPDVRTLAYATTAPRPLRAAALVVLQERKQ